MVIAIWAALFVVALGIAVRFPARLTTSAEFTNQPESVRAESLIEKRMTNGEPAPTDYPTAAALWAVGAVFGFLVVAALARALR